MALDRGLDNIIPILHEDYLVHLNYLKPILKTNIIALGRGKDHETEDSDFERIDKSFQYHGLAKVRWLSRDKPPTSVDSPTWLNPVRNGKIQLKLRDGYSEVHVSEHNTILDSVEENKDFVERCNCKLVELKFRQNHKLLLKLSLALHYMPLLKQLNMLEENFNI